MATFGFDELLMTQIFTNFPYLPRWYCFNIFLWHVVFWEDL